MSDATPGGPARPAAASLGYRAEIDGLRALSIAAVLLFHLDVAFVSGGFVGVDVFFVISGYLITRIILGELQAGRFSFIRFYERRARRILPAVFTMLLFAGLAAFTLLTPYEMNRFAEQFLHSVFQVSNFYFAEKVGYFDLDRTPSTLLHTWSLAVEEQFYLFWPMLLFFFARPGGRLAPEKLILIVGLISLALAMATVIPLQRFAFYHLPARAWELALGGLLATPKAQAALMRLLAGRPLREAAALSGFALIVGAALLIDKSVAFPGWNALPPTVGAALVIAAGGVGPTATGAALSLRPVVFLGLISYSLYLWHWPIIVFAKHYFMIPKLDGAMAFAIGAVSIAIATASWAFIERPFRRLRIKGRPLAIRAGLAAALLVSLGVTAKLTRDAEWRFPDAGETTTALFTKSPFGQTCVDSASQVVDFTKFEERCTFGPASPEFDVLVFGDSHARHYFDAVHAWAQREGLTARLISLGGCPPFFSDYRFVVRGKEQDRCYRNSAMVRDIALGRNKRTKYVFFAGRFSSAFRRDDRFGGQFYYDDEAQQSSTKASYEVYERGMRRTVEAVRAAGATPVILGEAPHLWRDPSGCEERKRTLLRRWLPLESDQPCGGFDVAYNSGVKRISDDALRRAAAAGDGLYFDPTPFFDSGFEDGVYLYADDNHWTLEGSLRLVPHLAAMLRQGRGEAEAAQAEGGTSNTTPGESR